MTTTTGKENTGSIVLKRRFADAYNTPGDASNEHGGWEPVPADAHLYFDESNVYVSPHKRVKSLPSNVPFIPTSASLSGGSMSSFTSHELVDGDLFVVDRPIWLTGHLSENPMDLAHHGDRGNIGECCASGDCRLRRRLPLLPQADLPYDKDSNDDDNELHSHHENTLEAMRLLCQRIKMRSCSAFHQFLLS